MVKVIKSNYNNHQINMTERIFVKQEDINELENDGIETGTAIPTFIKELCMYFNKVWNEDYHIKDDVCSLEELNKKHLHNYPSTQGYIWIDDSFTGEDCPIEILSDTSILLLGYFYRIMFQ